MKASVRLCVALAGAVIAAQLAATAACAQTPAPDKPLDPRVSMKVGVIGALSDAGIFIAYEKGFFRDEGLDVELVPFKAAPQILPAIATGEVQASGSAITPALLNAFERGVDMRIVADKGQVAKGFGFAAIAIRSDLADSIHDFKDLRGRKFAVPGKGVSSATQLGIALKLGGIEPKDVELVELGLPEMLAGLSNKAIDGATLLEPFVALAVAKHIAVRWKGMEDFLPFKGQNGIIIYSQRFAQDRPEAAKRWMAAYLRGTRAYTDWSSAASIVTRSKAFLPGTPQSKTPRSMPRWRQPASTRTAGSKCKASKPTRTGSSSSALSPIAPI